MTKTTTSSKEIDFLYEMGVLRFVQRTWKHFLNADFANVAEHMYRVMWIALILAKHEGCEDSGKILKMVLVHDITETRTNDVNYLSRVYVERHEESAIRDQLVDTTLAEEFIAIWQEYEERLSLESKIVKDADNLDVDLELREQAVRGVTLEKEWRAMRQRVAVEKLYTESAKIMIKQIWQSNPHDWHLKAPNRFTHGDWKK